MFDPLGQFELQVCPNGRAAADEYLHQGVVWIEGRENSKYVLKFTNRTARRVMVIFSVDGLDTIKGQPAGPNSEGYVVNANDSLEVPGWTLDNNNAAEFYFSKAGRSYVSASGANTSNTGVIGAMVFTEQIPFTFIQPYTYTSTLNLPTTNGLTTTTTSLPYNMMVGGTASSASYTMAGSSAALNSMVEYKSKNPHAAVGINAVGAVGLTPTVSQDVGTGFGDATQFNTVNTVFTRANPHVPDAILALYYNTAKNLQKLGIQLRTKSTRYDTSTAKAFPAYSSGCKPPPNWTP